MRWLFKFAYLQYTENAWLIVINMDESKYQNIQIIMIWSFRIEMKSSSLFNDIKKILSSSINNL